LNLQAIFGQFHSARVHLGLSYRWRSGCFAFSAHLFQQAAGGGRALRSTHKCNWLCAYSGGGGGGSVGGCARVHWRASLPRSFDARGPVHGESRQTFKTSFSANRFFRSLSLVIVGSRLVWCRRENHHCTSCSQGPDKRDLVLRCCCGGLCASARNGEIDVALDFDNIVGGECVKKTHFPLDAPRELGREIFPAF
jgi:hypothetical protein